MLSSDPERHRGIDGSSGSASTADDDDRVSNAACQSIAASPREDRYCVCARVISDCRTDHRRSVSGISPTGLSRVRAPFAGPATRCDLMPLRLFAGKELCQRGPKDYGKVML
jgi:hypothetical protein